MTQSPSPFCTTGSIAAGAAISKDRYRLERATPRSTSGALHALIFPGPGDVVAALLELLLSTNTAPTTAVDQATRGMIKHERSEAVVDFLQHEHISSTMFDNIVHTRSVPAERSEPVFGLDRVLLVLRSKEFGNGDQAIVPQLEPIPGDLPCVDHGEVPRQGRELVVEQSRVHERQVVVSPKVSQPNIRLKQASGDVLQETFLCLDQVRVVSDVVEDVKNLGLAFAHILEADTQDDPEVRSEITSLDVPRGYFHRLSLRIPHLGVPV